MNRQIAEMSQTDSTNNRPKERSNGERLPLHNGDPKTNDRAKRSSSSYKSNKGPYHQSQKRASFRVGSAYR